MTMPQQSENKSYLPESLAVTEFLSANDIVAMIDHNTPMPRATEKHGFFALVVITRRHSGDDRRV